jgi:calcineurin-like phosphoesterase family protein
MEYIISDTHFLHDNIWKYDLSRVKVMYHQFQYLLWSDLKKTNITLNEYTDFCNLFKNDKNESDISNEELYKIVDANKSLIRKIGDELMIYNWNNKVNNNDTVLHLGDLSMASTKDFNSIANIMLRLHGKIKLIMGNHDNKQIMNRLESQHLLEIISDVGIRKRFNHKIYFMSHYGIDTGGYEQLSNFVKENDCLPKIFSVSIHGHIHEDDYLEVNKFNVSVDNAISYNLNGSKLGQPILFAALDEYINTELLNRVRVSLKEHL